MEGQFKLNFEENNSKDVKEDKESNPFELTNDVIDDLYNGNDNAEMYKRDN